ncbi:Uncharacterised protein [Mycobacteroides abscessus subsp. abscessus]|nr:Uncharacterised protein [Mycobacteroides abscessus subsp. abscessus]
MVSVRSVAAIGSSLMGRRGASLRLGAGPCVRIGSGDTVGSDYPISKPRRPIHWMRS